MTEKRSDTEARLQESLRAMRERMGLPQEAERPSRLVRKAEEVEMVYWRLREHRAAFIVSPQQGFPLTTMQQHISQIDPGKHGGRHRHQMEAIIRILKGRGHSIIGEERCDWKEGDTLVIPSWTWHQHFNDDPAEPVVYLATTNAPLLRLLNLLRIEEAGSE